MQKIGLLGGTFDPVHNGHVKLADAALDRYGLDRIVFIPAANPPHKTVSAICDIDHRLHMLQLAVRNNARFEISELERGREKPSYTVDTLRNVRQYYPHNSSFYFIIGQEAFLEIETWYRYNEVLESVNFIVASRPGYPIEGYEALLERLGFKPAPEVQTSWLGNDCTTAIHLLLGDIINISSTDIRNRCKKGLDWEFLVPAEVDDYIKKNGLYT